MTKEEAINDLKDFIDTYITVHGEEDTIAVSLDNVDVEALDMAIEALQESKIKVLERDEILRRLGTFDAYNIYQAGAWSIFLKDLKHLGLKICEVKE